MIPTASFFITFKVKGPFLSFIIDTFGELRNKNAENTNDKENICFICQISRDQCLIKNIDFIYK